ncbi:MAG TPA: tetratricopeptide repeat protein [Bacteroidetes bacterium]|nr:tetratricopeptide repeat protein [Bacteroidota bacterium]
MNQYRQLFTLIALLMMSSCLLGQTAAVDSLLSLASAETYPEASLSLKHLDAAYSLASSLGDLKGECLAKRQAGKVYRKLGQMDKAIQAFQASAKLADEMGDLQQTGLSAYFLGDAYFRLDRFQEAAEKLNDALLIFKKTKNHEWQAGTMNALGNLYTQPKMGKSQKGLAYYEASYHLLDSIGSPEKVSPLFNMSYYFLVNKQAERAIPFVEKALAYFQSEKDPHGLAVAHGNLGYAHGLLGHFQKAMSHYKISVDTARKYQFRQILFTTYKDMSETYEQHGLYEEALAFYKKYETLKDSVTGKEMQESISALRVQYESEKKERELAESQAQVANLEQERLITKHRNLLVLLGLSGLLAIGGVLFFKTKSDQKKKRELLRLEKELAEKKLQKEAAEKEFIKKELDFKSRSLTNYALDIVHKNQFADELIDGLKGLHQLDKKAKTAKIKELTILAVSNLQVNENLQALQENVEEVNHEFYQKMEERFPKLSRNDYVLCSLLRLNLQNKEIATVRKTSESAIKMARYRLRKKLGLKPEEDIVAFLRRIA